MARIPLRRGEVLWVEEGLGGEVLELDGIACAVLGYATLVRTKSPPRDDPDDRPKDVEDVDRLRRADRRAPS